jgi:hypothetical protein
MKSLPADLAAFDQRRLALLFQRWPSLREPEMDELARLYTERLRLGRYVRITDAEESAVRARHRLRSSGE